MYAHYRIIQFEMHLSGNGIMSRTTECLHCMHLWVQLFSGILLYIVLCALHIFVYPPPWFDVLSCPEHTLTADHCVPTFAHLFNSGGWRILVFSYHNTTFHGATIPGPFLLHFRAFRFYITSCHTVKKGAVLWRCNSRLFTITNSVWIMWNLS